jgi:hypothetical protein
MNRLIREQVNRVTLIESSITTDIYDVTVSVFDEAGTYLKNKDGNDLDGKTALWDSVEHHYYFDIEFLATVNTGFVRVFWMAELKATHTDYQLSDINTPAEYELMTVSADLVNVPQIVPIAFFIDNFIAKDAKMDNSYKVAFESYLANNRRDLNRWLLAAQGDIEYDLKTVLFKKTDIIARDFYMQDFGSEFWIQQPNYRPIISVDKYALKYGSQDLDITKDIAPYILVEPLMGTFEFLPTAIQGNLFTALINGVSGLGISIMNTGSFNRVPFLFRIEYSYGLNFGNAPAHPSFPIMSDAEKESIRQAISCHTLIKLLPIFDPSVRITGGSKSIDGVSKSQSSGMAALLKTYEEQEAKIISNIKRKYALHFDMGIV